LSHNNTGHLLKTSDQQGCSRNHVMAPDDVFDFVKQIFRSWADQCRTLALLMIHICWPLEPLTEVPYRPFSIILRI